MGQAILLVVHILVCVVVEENKLLTTTETLKEAVHLLLEFVLEDPFVGWEVDLAPRVHIGEHSVAAAVVAEDLPALGSLASLQLLHRQMELLGVHALMRKYLEALPHALDRLAGSVHEEGNWDIPMAIKGAEPDKAIR